MVLDGSQLMPCLRDDVDILGKETQSIQNYRSGNQSCCGGLLSILHLVLVACAEENSVSCPVLSWPVGPLARRGEELWLRGERTEEEEEEEEERIVCGIPVSLVKRVLAVWRGVVWWWGCVGGGGGWRASAQPEKRSRDMKAAESLMGAKAAN